MNELDSSSCSCHCSCTNCRQGGKVKLVFVCSAAGCSFRAGSVFAVNQHKLAAHGPLFPVVKRRRAASSGSDGEGQDEADVEESREEVPSSVHLAVALGLKRGRVNLPPLPDTPDVAEQLQHLLELRREWLRTRPRPKSKKPQVLIDEEQHDLEENVQDDDINFLEPAVKVEVKQEQYDPGYERASRARKRPISYVEDNDEEDGDWTWEGGDSYADAFMFAGGTYDAYEEDYDDNHAYFGQDEVDGGGPAAVRRRAPQVKREPKAEVVEAGEEGTPFRCSRCDFVSDSRDDMADHVFGHSGRQFGCNYIGCNFRTDHPVLMSKHERDTHLTWVAERFTDNLTLVDNLAEAVSYGGSQGRSAWRCRACGFRCAGKPAFAIHVGDVHGNGLQEVQCQDCDFSATVAEVMYEHIKLTHVVGSGRGRCGGGGQGSRRRGRPPAVKEEVGDDGSVLYRCSRCEYVSDEKEDVRQHAREEHPGSHAGRNRQDSDFDSRQCPYCDYEAPNWRALQRHGIREHPEEFDSILCDMCGFATDTQEKLKSHKKAKHGSYQCEYCDFSTTLHRKMVSGNPAYWAYFSCSCRSSTSRTFIVKSAANVNFPSTTARAWRRTPAPLPWVRARPAPTT